MPRFICLGVLGWLAVGVAVGQDSPRPNFPAKATVTSKTTDDGRKLSIRVTVKLDPGWTVLANPSGNPKISTGQLRVRVHDKERFDSVEVRYPKGTPIKDDLLGEFNVYRDTVLVEVDITRRPNDTRAVKLDTRVLAFNNQIGVQTGPAIINHQVP
ncbi:: DsbC [Tuwongella immobilis]|uniref:: DsbC n=1 Tax=Tuwongella immobilis TaxID=692036 RepID=A0A6C2YV10_9BACT|nr:: DsbC [Tuwongella immobilis]VTS06869.1 : DsbC [Tuwongella immobilis]